MFELVLCTHSETTFPKTSGGSNEMRLRILGRGSVVKSCSCNNAVVVVAYLSNLYQRKADGDLIAPYKIVRPRHL